MEKVFELGEYEVLEDMLIDGLKIVQDTRLYRLLPIPFSFPDLQKRRRGTSLRIFALAAVS